MAPRESISTLIADGLARRHAAVLLPSARTGGAPKPSVFLERVAALHRLVSTVCGSGSLADARRQERRAVMFG